MIVLYKNLIFWQRSMVNVESIYKPIIRNLISKKEEKYERK